MLRYRVLSSVVMVAALIGLLWLDQTIGSVPLGSVAAPPGVVILGVFLLLIVLATREVAAISRAKGVQVDHPALAAAGAAGCLAMYAMPSEVNSQSALTALATLILVILMASLIVYTRLSRTQGALAVAGVVTFCFVYFGLLPGFYLAIRRGYSPWVVAGVIGLAKVCDIFAYFTGRAIGRHKLIHWLSPGKTWEGLIGGVCASGAAAVAIVATTNHHGLTGWWVVQSGVSVFHQQSCPLWYAGMAGAMIGLLGQLGDLTMSLLKRDAGVKDSGASVPGFGGVLDVIDSPLLVGAAGYWLLVIAPIISK